MQKQVILKREINRDVYNDLVGQGVNSWMADVISRRIDKPVDKSSLFSPSIGLIADPIEIPDMSRAVERIVSSIEKSEPTIFTVDHDMDGTAAGAVLWSAFVDHFGVDSSLLEVITSHRLTEGYGISEPVAERIIESSATLVISADKGSSDEPRIQKISAAGKDVIVTDHHLFPAEGPPKSAWAVVNPNRKESTYDPNISGAAVAFLTMAKVRSALIERGYKQDIPSLANLLDYVAVATVADCVSLRPDKSYTNRALVKYGLSLINNKSRPCWAVFKESVGGTITSENVAFKLAPAIAAAGRLDWADTGFKFLLAKDFLEAKIHWNTLQDENGLRKSIEKELRTTAFEMAKDEKGQAIVLFLEEGHSGVHGITASRLTEAFGKPSVIFSPKGAGARKDQESADNGCGSMLASGSFRGVRGFHVRDALQYVADNYPDLLIGFGGHEGAAGATIAVDDVEKFSAAFKEAAEVQLGLQQLISELWVDGDLSGELLTLDVYDQLMSMEPWGKDFPFPTFYGEFDVISLKPVGNGTHLRLQLRKDATRIEAIWFNAVEEGDESMPIVSGGCASLVYRLSENCYQGNRRIQLQIIAVGGSGNSIAP